RRISRSALYRRAPRAVRAGRETRFRTPGTEWSGSFANALYEPPAFVDQRRPEIEPGGVVGGYLDRLLLEHARDRNAPLARNSRSRKRSTSRVVGWLPVPNASPGSSRTTARPSVGGSCQLAPIQRRAPISSGANCAWLRRTQSSSSS